VIDDIDTKFTMYCNLPVALVIACVLCVDGSCALTDICSNSSVTDADLAKGKTSLIFEARVQAVRDTCGPANISSVNWTITAVHIGKSVIKKKTAVSFEKSVNGMEQLHCRQFCSNISYLIFAEPLKHGSVSSTSVLNLKWIFGQTRKSAELKKILCENCGKYKFSC
jgi:hypothetical protein